MPNGSEPDYGRLLNRFNNFRTRERIATGEKNICLSNLNSFCKNDEIHINKKMNEMLSLIVKYS